MRPDVPPKHIRVKNEPEIANARSIGVSTVLFAGAISRYDFIGDGSYIPYEITFTDLPSDSIVRFNYVHSGWGTTGQVKLQMTRGATVFESSIAVSYFTAGGIMFSGTAVVPAGTSIISPLFTNTYNNEFSESWSVDIIDQVRNDAYSVVMTDSLNVVDNPSLGESFVWVPASAAS